MAQYDWRCDSCAHETVVERPMRDYDVPPDAPCEKCKGTKYTKFIPKWEPQQTHLVHGGKAPWFCESYYGPKGIPTGR